MNREQFSDESANISEAFEFLIPMKFGFSQTKVGSVFQYKEVLTRHQFSKREKSIGSITTAWLICLEFVWGWGGLAKNQGRWGSGGSACLEYVQNEVAKLEKTGGRHRFH